MEDLGDERILKQICDWLEIKFHSTLMVSTWGGLRWWGDRISQNRIQADEKGFSPTISNSNWQLKLHKIDSFLLTYLMANRLDWYRYEAAVTKGLIWYFLVAVLIPIPSSYERNFLNLSNLWKLTRALDAPNIARVFYHYVRRLRYFYALLVNRRNGKHEFLEYFYVHEPTE